MVRELVLPVDKVMMQRALSRNHVCYSLSITVEGPMIFESARKKFQPKQIKILFIAEAPPPLDSKRFFYFVPVNRGDTLFLEMMKVLYPDEVISARQARNEKEKFLTHFQADGFFLIDACKMPLPKRASLSAKKRAIRAELRWLTARVKKLCGKSTKIVLISRPVYDICLAALTDFDVINREMIDFPGSGRQLEFRRKLSELLKKPHNGWS